MNDLRPFRFWCQKVLPLVYDDSLSYYELLCKVVDYLNKTMENVNSLSENFDELQSAFNTLKKYVEEYFENLNTEFVNKYLEVEEKYAWGMGNRILQVGKNLLELYKFNDIGGTRDSENVENVMNNVVTKFQILNMR